MLNKYWHTIKYLRPKQIWFRLYYFVKRKILGNKAYTSLQQVPISLLQQCLNFSNLIPTHTSYVKGNEFTFLNLTHTFSEVVDWNFDAYGKLWTYNLNYFDFLLQVETTKEEGEQLMLDFAGKYEKMKDAYEPYPTSLRIMNWIKFVAIHKIENITIDQVIYTDLLRLQKNIEYHLMGNHLLENAFALLFGAFYFKEEVIFKKAESILNEQLEEQILDDGAHFELSPMYHQIILDRILSCLTLIAENKLFETVDLQEFLKKTAAKMLGWLQTVSFTNGDIPHVNDSTTNIAPTTNQLLQFAKTINISPKIDKLKESGYHKWKRDNYELLIDIGNIGPDYIPGHAHSDTFNFVLYYNGQPLLVDTGISTYEKNEKRQLQRTTAAHNTVEVNEQDQSEVWDGFRVAQRAKSTIMQEDENTITASHDGYQNMNVTHQRTFQVENNRINIEDNLSKSASSKAFLHFHPNVSISIDNQDINGDFGSIKINGSTSIKMEAYQYALGFNTTTSAQVVVIDFKQKLETSIQFV